MKSAITARDLYDTKSVANSYVPTIVCTVISIIAVALRLLSRTKSRLALALDDYFVLIALAHSIACLGIDIWAFKECGWGKDPATATPEVLAKFLKSVYVIAPVSSMAIVWAKLAVLWLFRRIFGVDRTFRRCVDALIVYSIVWGIVVCCLIFFQCSPIQGGYDLKVRLHAKCINLSLVTVVTEPINCFSEFLMVLLPVNKIRQLHLPLRQRLGLSILFGLGILCVASSIIRSVEAWWPGAETVDLAAQALWFDIQLLVIILVSCFPTYRKLLPEDLGFISTYFRRQTYSLRHRTTTSRGDTSAKTKRSTHKHDEFDVQMLDTKNAGNTSATQLGTQHSRAQTENELPLELPYDRIHVKQDVSVV